MADKAETRYPATVETSAKPIMPKLIISYRRADTDAITGRIRDRLAAHYGEDSVFMDIDSIPLGVDFRDHIRDALFDCDLLLVVIGSAWLGSAKGRRSRISDETDPVRIEVETAIERGIPTIPVLVGGAQMPRPSDLPESLTNFAYRNAAEVDGGRDFHAHMDRLIRSMDRLLNKTGAAGGSAAPPAEPGQPHAGEPKPAPVAAQTPVAAGPTTPFAAPAASAQTPASAVTSRKTVWIAAAAIAAVAIIGVVTLLVFQMRPMPVQMTEQSGASPQSAPAPATPSPPQISSAPPAPTPPPAAQAPPVQPAPPPQAPAVQTPPPAPQAPPAQSAASLAPPGCQSGTASFHDNFRKPDSEWLTNTESSYANAQLVLKPPTDESRTNIYRSLIYKNATICLDVETPAPVDDNAGGGLAFWVEDNQNYYVALVTTKGDYRISRRFNNEWRTVTPTTKLASVKQGYGVLNRIRITTVGNTATVYFNDVKAQDVKGQPPKNGGSVGVYGEAEVKRSTEWRFLNIAVVEQPASQAAASSTPESARAMLSRCKLEPSANFSDDFKVSDPSWEGLDGDKAFYSAGQLILKPNQDKVWEILYHGLVYKDVAVCTEIRSPRDPKITSNSDGGLAFWAQDYRNYYGAKIYPEGSYEVFRYVDQKYITVVSKTNSAAVNKGPGAQNRLKVVLNKNIGELHINDTKVREFRGQPPADGSSFGLVASSTDTARIEWGFAGIVAVENP